MAYVLKSETKFISKRTGELITDYHYFQSFLKGMFPCFNKIEEAKKFDFKFEALEIKKKLGDRKRFSVVKV